MANHSSGESARLPPETPNLGSGSMVSSIRRGTNALVSNRIVLAAALAVGLGARDAVKEALARQLHDSPRSDDTVNHV